MSKKQATPSHLVEFFHATSKGKFVLFNIKPEDKKEGGPLMSGSCEIDDEALDGFKSFVSAFDKMSENDTRYLSLSFTAALPDGSPDDTPRMRFYGKLFRNQHVKSERAPQYSGFITVLPCTGPQQYTAEQWEAAPSLQVAGWARANASDGGARIECSFRPAKVQEHELAF